MSPVTFTWLIFGVSFPRVSGDEPGNGVLVKYRYEFSPRERG